MNQRNRSSRLFALVAITAIGCLAGRLTAQRQHVQGVTGEDPDTSNWPHPAAPDGNPYPRSTASAAELQRRDQVAQLGKVLFWDEQLSTDNTMACGTCRTPVASMIV